MKFLSFFSKHKKFKLANAPDYPLTILITNIELLNYTGTETAVRDLAIGFKKLGHNPILYSPVTEGPSKEIRNAGIPVFNNLAALTVEPDIIHGHHHIETLQAILRFPKVPVIFVCHDHTVWHDIPLKFSHIAKYVVVDQYCFNRLNFDYEIIKENIIFIPNCVDTNRFKKRQPLPKIPQKALIFSSYTKEDSYSLEIIQRACNKVNLKIDVLGFGIEGKGKCEPETLIGEYDIVFAKGRCALEAAAVGCSVISMGTTGFGEMLTSSNVLDLRNWSFIKHINKYPIDEDIIIEEIKKYNVDDAEIVTTMIREHANLEKGLHTYLNLYYTAIQEAKTRNNDFYDPSKILSKYIKSLLLKINQFELARFRLLPLPKDICTKLQLNWIACPDKIMTNTKFKVHLELTNLSDYTIGDFFPCPMHFCYTWFAENSVEIVENNSMSIPLNHCASSQATTKYTLDIDAPKENCLYRFVITLIQQSVQKFDQTYIPIKLEKMISVYNSD